MAFEIKLPDLGEGVVEGEIVKILVSKGETVSLDQPLMEVMTDKASMEIPSSKEGIVQEVAAKPGDRVAVGQTVLILAPLSDKSAKNSIAAGAAAGPATAGAAEALAKAGGGGAQTNNEEAAFQADRQKSAMAQSASKKKESLSPSSKAESAPPGPVSPSKAKSALESVSPSEGGGAEMSGAAAGRGGRPNRPLAAPFVRKLAEDLNIPLQAVGKKAGEKISRADLVRHIKNLLEAGGVKAKGSAAAALSAGSLPAGAGAGARAGGGGAAFKDSGGSAAFKDREGGELAGGQSGGEAGGAAKEAARDRRELLTGIKRAMFESMTRSLAVPHFTVIEQANGSRLIKLREELKPRLAQQGLKLTYLPFIIRAAALCLKKFPILNSSYDVKSGEIVYKKSLNISFAADTDRGLTAPVIHKAENKAVLELTRAVQSLAEAARTNKITREQLLGGTFTVTNLGSVGGIAGTPVITPPQAAVLGIYRIERRPQIMKGGSLGEAPFMSFSLTCDHRLIDGATAARFLKSFILKIEDPGLLLLGD